MCNWYSIWGFIQSWIEYWFWKFILFNKAVKLNVFIHHTKKSLALLNHKNSQWLKCWPLSGRLELKLLLSFIQSKVLNLVLSFEWSVCESRVCQVFLWFVCSSHKYLIIYSEWNNSNKRNQGSPTPR